MFSSESYDRIFASDPEYLQHYKNSSYLPVWKIIASKMKHEDPILDIGCGPGQFANFLHDQGFTDYTGIDYSVVAITTARQLVPSFTFIHGDVTKLNYRKYRGYVITAIESMEHIEDDRALIRRLPPARLIFSVPNYPAPNHYRTYRDEMFIAQYYRNIIDIDSITRYHCKGPDFIFIVDSFTHRKP